MALPRQSWLTAFLDGELTSAQRLRVERELAKNPDLQRELDQIRWIADQVAKLDQRALPKPVESTLRQALQRLQAVVDERTPPEIDLLLAAYAFDELDADGRAHVEKLLLEDESRRQAVDAYRQTRSLLVALSKSAIPTDLVGRLIERLPTDRKNPRPRRSWREQLSAYIDGEVSERRRSRIDLELPKSAKARQHLADLTRTKSVLGGLPIEKVPDPLVASVLDQLKIESTSRPAPAQRFSVLPLLALAASLVIVAGSGFVLSQWTLGPRQQIARVNVEPARAAAAQRPAPTGIDDLRDLLVGDESLREQLDRRQVTLSSADVDKLLDSIGLAEVSLSVREKRAGNRRVVMVEGEAQHVGQMLRRLEQTSRQGSLVRSVIVDFASEELRVQMGEPRVVEVPRRPATPKPNVDIVGAVRRGLERIEQRFVLSPIAADPPTPPSPSATPPTAKPTPAPVDLNAPAVLARPVRIYLVVEQDQPAH